MTDIGAPSYTSLGLTPTRLFETYDDGRRHGNFFDASYLAICAELAWKARTEKAHSQMQALPSDKRLGARELDSCNSSDALLMNCFCYPGAAERIVATLLPSVAYTTPSFGVRGEVAPIKGGRDATEIDMQIGSAIFEAKLTEHDFTSRPKSHVERYAGFMEIFEVDALPQSSERYHGDQLIPHFRFERVSRPGHNRSTPARNAGSWGCLAGAEGIIQWVTRNLARFASRSILNFASSSGAPRLPPTRDCCSRASWTSVWA